MIHQTIATLVFSTSLCLAQNPASTPAPTAPAAPELNPTEKHIRVGIVYLHELEQCLSLITTPQRAQQAIPTILRLTKQLKEWGQGFTTMVPLNEEDQAAYEKAYIPIIEKINASLRLQAERLNSAEYYGTNELRSVLIELVSTLQ